MAVWILFTLVMILIKNNCFRTLFLPIAGLPAGLHRAVYFVLLVVPLPLVLILLIFNWRMLQPYQFCIHSMKESSKNYAGKLCIVFLEIE